MLTSYWLTKCETLPVPSALQRAYTWPLYLHGAINKESSPTGASWEWREGAERWCFTDWGWKLSFIFSFYQIFSPQDMDYCKWHQLVKKYESILVTIKLINCILLICLTTFSVIVYARFNNKIKIERQIQEQSRNMSLNSLGLESTTNKLLLPSQHTRVFARICDLAPYGLWEIPFWLKWFLHFLPIWNPQFLL